MARKAFPLQGPAGNLEAVLDTAAEQRGAALLCHPHPLYGGSLHDLVLATAADALLATGISCLRFNFRGVGSSEGSFDDGRGEAEDVRAALSALETHAGSRPLLLGYSFGAWAAWQAVIAGARPERLLLIAPPVGAMDFSGSLSVPDLGLQVLVGDSDAFAPLTAVQDWTQQQGGELHALPATDHFFQTTLPQLQERVATAVSTPE